MLDLRTLKLVDSQSAAAPTFVDGNVATEKEPVAPATVLLVRPLRRWELPGPRLWWPGSCA